jgi:hypothetical protein
VFTQAFAVKHDFVSLQAPLASPSSLGPSHVNRERRDNLDHTQGLCAMADDIVTEGCSTLMWTRRYSTRFAESMYGGDFHVAEALIVFDVVETARRRSENDCPRPLEAGAEEAFSTDPLPEEEAGPAKPALVEGRR